MKSGNLRFEILLWFSKFRGVIAQFGKATLITVSLFSIILVIYELGFDVSARFKSEMRMFYAISLFLFLIAHTGRILANILRNRRIRFITKEIILYLFIVLIFLSNFLFQGFLHRVAPIFLLFGNEKILVLLVFLLSLYELSKRSISLLSKGLNPSLLFAGSFLFIILLGAGLLLLPRSTVNGISYADALFTSTSAVCVTGLTAVETATTFTTFGKTIILLLIQTGGIGVMTFTSFFALFFMGQPSYQNQMVIKDLINADHLSEILKTLQHIVLVTLTIEAIGVWLIYQSIVGTTGLNSQKELMVSIFHSVSAFCNAGFSTFQGNLNHPILHHNIYLHLIISFLIILGGLGFPILFNYGKLGHHYLKNAINLITHKQKRYLHIPRIINVNSRLVLYTTLILLVSGTLLFYISEANNSLAGMSVYEKWSHSFFMSVTPRTAGFNTLSMSSMSTFTVLLTIFFMWVGASPMSTGGGIKTTTFALALLNITHVIRGKRKIEVFRREVDPDSVQRAFAVVVLSLGIIALSTGIMAYFDQDKSLLRLLYEAFSALGTVGLSLDLTTHLSAESKYVLIFLMFIGRVGILGLLMSMVNKQGYKGYSYPKEIIMI